MVNHTTIFLSYNTLQQQKIFSPFHDIMKSDSTFLHISQYCALIIKNRSSNILSQNYHTHTILNSVKNYNSCANHYLTARGKNLQYKQIGCTLLLLTSVTIYKPSVRNYNCISTTKIPIYLFT